MLRVNNQTRKPAILIMAKTYAILDFGGRLIRFSG
jgi:hypothetical protein